MEERSLNHFTLLQFTEAYWGLPANSRRDVHQRFWGRVRETADRVDLYQVFPARADADLLLWCAVRVPDPDRPGRFLADLGTVLSGVRPYLRPVQVLWGFTKPSVYARGQSPQEIDPFADRRKAYLVVYPFVKTAEWYLLSKDTRQGMMNEQTHSASRTRSSSSCTRRTTSCSFPTSCKTSGRPRSGGTPSGTRRSSRPCTGRRKRRSASLSKKDVGRRIWNHPSGSRRVPDFRVGAWVSRVAEPRGPHPTGSVAPGRDTGRRSETFLI